MRSVTDTWTWWGLGSSVLLTGALLLAGCGSSGYTADSEQVYQDSAEVIVDDDDRMRARRVEDLLVGRVSGVRVQQTSSGIRVIIRGQSSIVGSSEPLYVVDGMPVEAAPGRALIGLNPSDIKSIRVLKDPVDTSMYGMRGANGVVIVTTLVQSSRAAQKEEDE